MAKTKKGKVAKANKESCCTSSGCKSGCSGAIYGLSFIGAAIYYISAAVGFWAGVLGVLKALVWPAFVIYEALQFLGA